MADLIIDVKTTGTSKVTQLDNSVKKLDKSAKNTTKTTKELSKSIDATSKTAKTATSSIAAMGIAVAGVIAARKVIAYSDSWKSVEGRLRLVTDSTSDLIQKQKELFAIAQDTRQSFEATANLYTRMARAAKTLGTSQEDLLIATKAINQALVVSGASAQEAQSTLIQLSQGLASGVLRGEEFNSIMENGSRIAQALSDSLGVTTGELRAMSKVGGLTADVVMKALIDQAQKINSEFSTMPLTISQALQSFDNSMLKIVARAEQGTGAMANLATSIKFIGQAFEEADQFWFGDRVIDAQTRWIEENNKFIQQMREQQGLIPNVIENETILTDLRFRTAEILGVTFESLSQLNIAQLENLRITGEQTNFLNQLEAQSKANEIADIEYFNAQAALFDISKQVVNAGASEIDMMAQKSQSLQQLTQSTKQQTEAVWSLHDAEGNLNPTVRRPSNDTVYTVTTQIPSFNTFNNTIDESVSVIDSFNTTINKIDNSMRDFQRVIKTIESSLSSSIGGLAGIAGQSQLSQVGYLESLKAATDAQQELIDNPLSTFASTKFTEAFSQFQTSASSFVGASSRFETAESQQFARVVAIQQELQLQETATLTVDVQEETKNLLASIDAAIADGILTTEEKSVIAGVAGEVNAKNDLLLGSSGVVASNLSHLDSSINGQEYFNNTGLALDSSINGQEYFNNTGLALDTSLIGENSVSAILQTLDVSTDMTGLETVTNQVATAVGVGNDALASIKTSNSYMTANNSTSLKNLQVKTQRIDYLGYYITAYDPSIGVNRDVTTWYDGTSSKNGGTSTTITYYKQGGFTNKGESNTEAGVVHAGEWVAPQWMVNSNAELFRNLESARQKSGFQIGGIAPSNNIVTAASSTNNGNIKTNQYLFVLADEMKKINSLLRRVTNGGAAMRSELVG